MASEARSESWRRVNARQRGTFDSLDMVLHGAEMARWQAEQDRLEESEIAKVAAQRSARISELEAEVAFYTKPLECKIVHEQPYDFKQCETHDCTFPLDGDCDYRGLSLIEYDEQKHHEQRGRAVRAEMRAEAAEAKLAEVRAYVDEGLDGMPPDPYDEALGTLRSMRRILDGEA